MLQPWPNNKEFVAEVMDIFISGGSAENAIASSGNADIAVYSNQVTALEEAFSKIRQTLLDEYTLVKKKHEALHEPNRNWRRNANRRRILQKHR